MPFVVGHCRGSGGSGDGCCYSHSVDYIRYEFIAES